MLFMTQVQGWHSGGCGECLQNGDKARDRLSLCKRSTDQMAPAEAAAPRLLQEPEQWRSQGGTGRAQLGF